MAKTVLGAPKQAKTKTETKQELVTTTAVATVDQAQESAKLATENGNSNVQSLIYAENADDNEMLTRAAKIGEKLGDDAEFAHDIEDIDDAARINDTKIVTMLRHLETKLEPEELEFLPRPMSTRAEAIAKRKSDNEPLLYDKPKASGGRSKVETFYSNLVKHTPLGKRASEALDAIAKELALLDSNPDNPNVRDGFSIGADKAVHERTLRNLLGAIRAAAEARVILNELKEHKNIVIEWLREGDAPLADGKDATMVTAAPVVKVSRCLLIYNKAGYASERQAWKKAKTYSLGTVKRWNIAHANEWRLKSQTPRSYINMDDLIASPKSPIKAGQPSNQLPASTAGMIQIEKAKRYEATTITEAENAINGFLTWYMGASATDQQNNHTTLLNLILHSDEGNATFYQIAQILQLYDSKPALRNKAIEFIKAQEQSKKTA